MNEHKGSLVALLMFLAFLIPGLFMLTQDVLERNAFTKNKNELEEMINENGGVNQEVASYINELQEKGYIINVTHNGQPLTTTVDVGERIDMDIQYGYTAGFIPLTMDQQNFVQIEPRDKEGSGSIKKKNVKTVTISTDESNIDEILKTYNIPDLKRIVSAKTNTGQIEITEQSDSTGDVKFKLTEGSPYRTEVSEETIPEHRKYITDYNAPYYNLDGYSGSFYDPIMACTDTRLGDGIFFLDEDDNNVNKEGAKRVSDPTKKCNPLQTKQITRADNITEQQYEDDDGYKGTLYPEYDTETHGAGNSNQQQTIEVEESYTYASPDNIPDTVYYDDGTHKGILVKDGEPEERLVSEGYEETITTNNGPMTLPLNYKFQTLSTHDAYGYGHELNGSHGLVAEVYNQLKYQSRALFSTDSFTHFLFLYQNELPYSLDTYTNHKLTELSETTVLLPPYEWLKESSANYFTTGSRMAITDNLYSKYKGNWYEFMQDVTQPSYLESEEHQENRERLANVAHYDIRDYLRNRATAATISYPYLGFSVRHKSKTPMVFSVTTQPYQLYTSHDIMGNAGYNTIMVELIEQNPELENLGFTPKYEDLPDNLKQANAFGITLMRTKTPTLLMTSSEDSPIIIDALYSTYNLREQGSQMYDMQTCTALNGKSQFQILSTLSQRTGLTLEDDERLRNMNKMGAYGHNSGAHYNNQWQTQKFITSATINDNTCQYSEYTTYPSTFEVTEENYTGFIRLSESTTTETIQQDPEYVYVQKYKGFAELIETTTENGETGTGSGSGSGSGSGTGNDGTGTGNGSEDELPPPENPSTGGNNIKVYYVGTVYKEQVDEREFVWSGWVTRPAQKKDHVVNKYKYNITIEYEADE